MKLDEAQLKWIELKEKGQEI